MKVNRTVIAACAALTAAAAMGLPGDEGEGLQELHECPLLPKETRQEKDARMKWWADAWETCQTFSGSWGYFRDEETWKNSRQLLVQLVDGVSKKGNLLLNVGPTARGEFDGRAREVLAGMGAWMDLNGRSVYGCTAAPEELRKQCPEGCRMTYNPETRTIYLHILEWPIKVLPITFSDKVDYAQFLHDASEIQIKQPRHVSGSVRTDVPASLMLPVKKPHVEIPVVEMFLR